ncbi:hypothetical protein GQX74_015336 [Glossina fuscipes]|nr:hypothetical protein GQX74_015336 [Glossina fuscipes]
MVARGQGERECDILDDDDVPNPREMAGLADMEPPTKNNSMSGQPSTASGWPKSQNAIASQPPGEPYGPSCLLNRYNQVDSEKSSKCKDVALVSRYLRPSCWAASTKASAILDRHFIYEILTGPLRPTY